MIKYTQEEYDREDPSKKLVPPAKLLSKTIDLVRKIGPKQFLTSAGYNTEREHFPACMFAFSLREHFGKEHYIIRGGDPPDFFIAALTNRPIKEKPIDIFPVEVVDVTKWTYKPDGGELDDVLQMLIKKKAKNYNIDRGTVLLIFLNCENSSRLETQLSAWWKKNSAIFSRYSDVVLQKIFVGADLPYSVMSLNSGWKTQQVLLDECRKPVIQHQLTEKYSVEIVDD